ncbi:MAG: cyclic nucleotide-binding domain-containing protein [Bacteroidota bacterium]|jgi:CRP/FNR family cyclic AMP-dependent transcriptional regulator
MDAGALGKTYNDGEIIVHQGDEGHCMFVIQSGKVEILHARDGDTVRLAIREEGDFFGEMAVFEREKRMATVRAMGTVRVLTVDKKNLLRRFQEDPSLAFRIVETMSHRIRELSEKVTRQPAGD